jgi:hypothetical protein
VYIIFFLHNIFYFFKIGFNSYQESGKLAKSIKEPLFVNSKNIFEVCFVRDNCYWDGTLLNIPRSNAARFYSLVQKKYIDWRIFSSAVLSRFDLYSILIEHIKQLIKFLSESFWIIAKKI